MILGIDIGTTGVKAVLLDHDGHVLSESEHAHDLQTPRPTWAEEDPEDWWRGTVETVSQVLAGRGPRCVQAVGVSGMVPALLLLDERGNPLRPSIQQNDARVVEEIQACKELYPEDELFARSGSTWNQQVLPPKFLWLRRYEPDLWKRLYRLSGSYEYIAFRLTGSIYSEVNWALESGLWDVKAATWNSALMDLIEVPRVAFPEVKQPHEVVGEIQDPTIIEAGLDRATPVIAGSADHIAAALAAGLRSPGEAVLKFGGGADFLYVIEDFSPLRQLFIDYHDLPGLFVLNGCMSTSGSLVKWFRDQFRAGHSFADLDHQASSVSPGSDGLIVLPYFLGEKTPIHDPEARGTVVGLTLSHTPSHVYRAILEGVAYAFRHHIEVLEAAGHRVDRYYVMDGGARSVLWRSIVASVLGREVHYLKRGHVGSAYGVALVAGVAAGRWGWSDLPRASVVGTTEPEPRAVPVYGMLYTTYREIYRRLKDLYPALGHSSILAPSLRAATR